MRAVRAHVPHRWRRRLPKIRARRAVAVALLLGVALATAGGLGSVRWDTGPESFLPADDDTLAALHETARSFGGDPIVVLAESAKSRQLLGPEQLPELLALEGRLARLPDVAAVYGPATMANQLAISSQNLLAELSGHRDRIRAEAERRARDNGRSAAVVERRGDKAVAAFDARYGSLLVRGLPAGLPTLHNPGFVDAVIFTEGGAPRARWRFVVPRADAVAILIRPRQELDQAGVERLVGAVRTAVRESGLAPTRLTVSGAPALASALGGQVRREIVLLGGLAIGAIGACYLATPWLRRRRLRLIPLLATLAATSFVLAAFGWLGRPLSLGVITFLPILLGIGSDFPAYLMRGAPRRRLVVAALAAAAGFASLAISPLPFVRDLGIALAVGVLASLTVGMVLVRSSSGRHRLAEAHPKAREPRAILPRGRRITVLALAGSVAAAGWFGLPHLDVQSRPDVLAAGLPAVDDVHYVEDVLGASGEIRIALHGNDVTTPEALSWMRDAHETAILGFGGRLRPIVSPPDLLRFLGPSPKPEQIIAGLRQLPSYLTGAVVRNDSRRADISLGIQLQDLAAQHRLLDELGAALPPPPEGLDAEVVGLPVAADRAYELISRDRYLTNTLGIVLAGLVLFVGLRRRGDALRAVLAAVLATGWGLAGAWAFAIALSPLTVALGSLTTVIACEYTVVLAERGGAPMTRTVAVAALTATCGYLVLAASGLAVIHEFGVVLAGTVVLAFVAAHLVLRVLPHTLSLPGTPVPARQRIPMEVT